MTQINEDNLHEVIEKFNWKCRFTDVCISMNMVESEDELDLKQIEISNEQYVVSVGPHVTDIIVGDVVYVDLEKLSTQTRSSRDMNEITYSLNITPIPLEGDYAVTIINDRAIKLIKPTE